MIEDTNDLHQILLHARVAQLLATTCELGILDAVDDGADTVDTLAEATATHRDPLCRLVHALIATGVLRSDQGRVRLTDVGHALLADQADTLRDRFRFFGGPGVIRPWLQLAEVVRGHADSGWDALGLSAFEGVADHRDAFWGAMGELTGLVAEPVAAWPGWNDRTGTVVDVGGAPGMLLARVIQRHEHLRGIVFDATTAHTPDVLRRAHVTDRVTTGLGDFFTDVPVAETYLLKSCLHDWQDTDAAQILTTIRRSAPPDARLLVIEQTTPGVVWHLSDINMLATSGGRERTYTEFTRLLNDTGWALPEQPMPLPPSPFTLIPALAD